MTTTWQNTLKDFEPDIEKLCMFLEEGSRINLSLYQTDRNTWEIVVQETYPEYVQFPPNNIEKLNQRIEWMEKQLSAWDGVHRTGYDSWEFDDKRIADKFVLLYNILWVF